MTREVERAITVTVEWALWGKEDRDPRDYHLLRCSTGRLSRTSFTRYLTRYSPGTLGQLPQVSLSWIREPDGHGSHLAMAFHETSEKDPPDAPARGRLDAVGREIVFVRYFCVPYEQLAEHSIGYLALYNALKDVRPPGQGGNPIRVPVRPSLVLGPAGNRPVAQAIAAQLLTSAPVCILGGDHMELAERLGLIDQVMSLLPYGMRNCLSASTWVNNSSRHHRFRLFFASAPRPGGGGNDDRDDADADFGGQASADVVVDLRQNAITSPPASESAHLYLDWARQAQARALTKLARQVTPRHLGRLSEIQQAIKDLPSLDKSIPDILAEMAAALRDGALGYLDECIQHLRRQLNSPTVDINRRECQAVITNHDLLRARWDRLPDAGMQSVLLDTVVRVAVPAPLSYEGFCVVRDCARGNLHQSLLMAMDAIPADGPFPLILIGNALHHPDERIFHALREQGAAPDGPLAALDAGATRIAAEHGPVVFDVARRYLLAETPDPVAALRGLGYLDGLVARFFSLQSDRVNQLRVILNDAYGPQLSHADVREILARSGSRPTRELADAVHDMTRWKRVTRNVYFQVTSTDLNRAERWPLQPSRRQRRWYPRPWPRLGFGGQAGRGRRALTAPARRDDHRRRGNGSSAVRAVGFVFFAIVVVGLVLFVLIVRALH